jgi:hypothetical protein
MIVRQFPTIRTAWQGLIEELAYHHKDVETVGQGGITTSYADGLVCEIDDALKCDDLHLNMSSYGKNRWRTFLKRYFRPDLQDWVDSTVVQLGNLKKHQVASYSISLNPEFEQIGRKGYGSSSKGHRHGACLSSLQLQHFPCPKVIVVSRASQIDKAGFLDLSLMNRVAVRTGWSDVRGTWVVSMPFIAAVHQIFYSARFGRSLKGHSLEKSTRRFWLDDWRLCKYGPQKRSVKKAQEWKETKKIFRSCPVDELSLEFENV